MKYLIPLLLMTGCATVQEVSHPIDVEKQQALANPPVLEVNPYTVSTVLSIIAFLILAMWFIAWRKSKTVNSETLDSQEHSS